MNFFPRKTEFKGAAYLLVILRVLTVEVGAECEFGATLDASEAAAVEEGEVLERPDLVRGVDGLFAAQADVVRGCVWAEHVGWAHNFSADCKKTNKKTSLLTCLCLMTSSSGTHTSSVNSTCTGLRTAPKSLLTHTLYLHKKYHFKQLLPSPHTW